MKIMRFLDSHGKIRYGQPVDKRTATLIEGDLFTAPTLTQHTAVVAKRLAPVDPPNVFAIGLNYRKHAEESNMPLPSAPVIFIKATTTVTAVNMPIILPTSAPDEVDYECELAIVIAKEAKSVSEDQAIDYVLGYTCANDVSARDCQIKHDVQWARAKSFDTFCPLGPVIVTPDEIDGDNCPIRTILNGQVLQDSNTNDLIFNCRQLVSYLSHQFTLLPGTVILSGTPSGVGFARKPPVYMKDGDEVTIEIDGIGQLTNPVVLEKAGPV
ncbi:MAG: fumarylacetoacetate hydrolase family protein [Phycisphaerae bacterium]|nr:fumarylacetoacetate hydrolase family protein [Phycisphaerae bacterium]